MRPHDNVPLSMLYLKTKTAYILPRIPFGGIIPGLHIFTDVNSGKAFNKFSFVLFLDAVVLHI